MAVSGVTGDRNQAKITIVGVPDKPGIASKLFGPVAEANINVDMIIQNMSQSAMTDISFTIPRAGSQEGRAADSGGGEGY